ncbi:MAG TPA: lytic transglycosylase domain-containing protein [Thermoanaerobaculia bacterium]|nr:lytic transglycosylase domain-containing protein [Thermoanaerobaculia bacterium]
MNEPIRTPRKWRERVIEGFDRSRLRQEALRARRGRFSKLRKRYGSMVLGASLAVGGIGIPMATSREAPDETRLAPEGLSGDLETARRIAREVAGGVEEAIPFGRSVQERLTESQIDLVTERVREDFFASEVPFGSIIYREARRNDLPPELVAAIVQTESAFKPTARSGAGAQGLMQLMPKTGAWMGARNLMSPAENVKAGTKYLKYLNERFGGDQTLVLAAYNAGEGNVRRYGGIPPFRETRNYVKKVASAEKDFQQKVSGTLALALESGAAALLGEAAPVAATAR